MSEVVTKLIEEQSVPGKSLGRHVEHDPQSRAYGIVTAKVPLVSVRHIRHGIIFNQGDLGSCTGNAGAGCINTVPLWTKGNRLLHESDAITIYGKATVIDGFPGSYPPDDTGSSGLAVCKVMKTMGLITSYLHAFGIDAALQALMKRSFMTGINWYEGFDNPDAAGIVKKTGQIRGGHEIECNQYVSNKSGNPMDALLGFNNSWGVSWGIKGRFYMTVRTFADLLAEEGDVTVPII